MLPKLNSLIIANNKLSTANGIAHLVDCKTLSIVDLSHNYLDDPEIVDVIIIIICLILTITIF